MAKKKKKRTTGEAIVIELTAQGLGHGAGWVSGPAYPIVQPVVTGSFNAFVNVVEEWAEEEDDSFEPIDWTGIQGT
ncbi:MAG: hypothetical protein ACQSGP_23155 [Frankia sp.]